MSTAPRRQGSHRRFAAFGLAAALAAAGLGGCSELGDVTASMTESKPTMMPTDDVSLRAYADHWGQVYDKNPGEKYASMNYARALRALTRYTEAAAVMQAAAVKAPKDFEVLGAYGKALADAGSLDQARDVLTRAYPAERPDWTILSVQGSVADRLNDHEGAQRFYREALKIAPGEPTVLCNLGLSYALTKQLSLAEDTLHQAVASPKADARVRQNLALVLALDGKFVEAEQISRRDMSPEDAAKNVRAIRDMIAQSESWKTLRSSAAKSRTNAAPAAPLLSPPDGPV